MDNETVSVSASEELLGVHSSESVPLDTGRKLNVHNMFRRRP